VSLNKLRNDVAEVNRSNQTSDAEAKAAEEEEV